MSSRWWPKDWDRRYKKPKSVSSVGFLGSVFCSTPLDTSLWSQVCNEVLKHPANLLSDVLFANKHIIYSDQQLAILVLVWWPRRRRRRSHCLFEYNNGGSCSISYIRTGEYFIDKSAKNATEGFSWWKICPHHPHDWLSPNEWIFCRVFVLSVCPFSNKDDFVKTICCVRLTENSRSLFVNLRKRKYNKLLRLN